ncbi:family 43 glycosylhydrolase [Kitasatospora indigofera]|uniref:family 43 glycosylhydrolase n=1 Tax=Kitasatospora indigofera TaxID=67307 RepID=UPI00363DA011
MSTAVPAAAGPAVSGPAVSVPADPATAPRPAAPAVAGPPAQPPEQSLVHVRGAYHRVTATYGWLPGVTVERSADLAVWRPLGGVLDEPRLVDLTGVPDAGGVRSPCLSRADGVFHLVHRAAGGAARADRESRAVLVTAPSLHGPWSDPMLLPGPILDPFLFHDDGPGGDGRSRLLWREPSGDAGGGARPGLLLQEYDRARRSLTGPAHRLVTELPADGGPRRQRGQAGQPRDGRGPGRRPDAPGPVGHPRLHARDGWYYLLGTDRDRAGAGGAVTVARARAVTGPYRADPAGPLVRSGPGQPFPGGAVDLLPAPGGGWLLAAAAPDQGGGLVLQRVRWSADGWPRAVGRATPAARRGGAGGATPAGRAARAGGFGGARLGPEWRTLRRHADPSWLVLADGRLQLRGDGQLAAGHRLSLVARPAAGQGFDFRVVVSGEPDSPLCSAGLVLFRAGTHWHHLHLGWDEALGRVLRLRVRAGDDEGEPAAPVPVGQGPLRLRLSAEEGRARFRWYDTRGGRGRTGWRTIGPVFDPGPGGGPTAGAGALDGGPAGPAYVGVFAQDGTGRRSRATFGEPYYRVAGSGVSSSAEDVV